MGHKLKELHRQEEISTEEEMNNGPKSVCCNAPMQGENNQCIACGADGSHFVTEEEQQKLFDAAKEKQELIDEKINDEAKQLN